MKLQVSDLSYSYQDMPVLNQISFSLQQSEFVSILGPSGCGKSTILNLLAGLLPMQQGSISVEGEAIHGISGHFAYMPQNDLLFS